MLDTLLSQVICLHGFLWPNNCVTWYHHPHSIECFKGLVQSLTNKDLNSRPVRFQSLAPLLPTSHPPPAAAETPSALLHSEEETAAQRGEGNCPRTNPELMVPRQQDPGVLASFPGQLGKKAGTRALELDRRGLNPSCPVCKL